MLVPFTYTDQAILLQASSPSKIPIVTVSIYVIGIFPDMGLSSWLSQFMYPLHLSFRFGIELASVLMKWYTLVISATTVVQQASYFPGLKVIHSMPHLLLLHAHEYNW